MFRILNMWKTWKIWPILKKNNSIVACPKMTQMLELSGNAFKAAIVILLHVVKVNTLEINDKIEVLNWKSKEQRLKNIKRTHIHVIRAQEGEEKDWNRKKNFWRNNSRKLPKYGKRFKFTDSRISVHPKQDKFSENHTQTHNQAAKKPKIKQIS